MTPDATVADALITLQSRLAHAAAGFALEGILGGTCVCHINGRIVNAWTALSHSADVAQFFLLSDAPGWSLVADVLEGHAQGAAPFASPSVEAALPLPASQSAAPPQGFGQDEASENAVAAESGLSDPSLPAFYTCFNYLEQRSLRRKEPGWTDEDCRLDAVSKVWFAVFRAILLRDPVEGFPLPQVLVFKITDLNDHIPAILAFQGERCEPLVCNIPRRSSVATFLSGFRHGPGMPGHGVIDVPGGYTCSAGGVRISCFNPLPPEVTVIRVRRALSAEHPGQDFRPPPVLNTPDFVVAGTGSTDVADAAKAAAHDVHLANQGGAVHTCFDSLIGPRFREQQADWSPLRCLEDCEVSAAHIPNPVGRLLAYVVDGLPEPQTIITNRLLLPTHHSFVLACDRCHCTAWAPAFAVLSCR